MTSFPAAGKRRDPRYAWFVRTYGTQCWELDAMNPNRMREKVEEAIVDLLDIDAWKVCKRAEAAQVETFQTVLTAMKRQVATQI